jgi:hypothetical protein
MNPTHFLSWLAYIHRVIYSDGPKPDSTRFRVLLSMASDFLPALTDQEVFQRELVTAGYGRAAVTWQGQGILDSLNNLHSFNPFDISITAGTSDLVFRSLVVVADSSTDAHVEVSYVDETIGDIIIAGSHSFSSGDRTLFASTGALPMGMPSGFLTVESLSTNRLRLYYNDELVIPQSPGSGRRVLRLLPERMRPCFFQTLPQNAIVPSFTTRNYSLLSRMRG